jgi:DNA-binding NtrC family response regulator
MKLLLVEDDPSHAELMREHLSGLGAEVVAVDTIAGAMRLLESKTRFDLAVLDQDLPDGSAFDVQNFLNDGANPLPVLFVTADDQVEHAVLAMKQGARAYVVKRPDFLTQLTSEVSSIGNAFSGSVSRSRGAYEERERRRLSEALERNRWNVSATARELGIGRGMLRSRMSALGLDD